MPRPKLAQTTATTPSALLCDTKDPFGHPGDGLSKKCGGCWTSDLISARKLLDWFGWNIALCGGQHACRSSLKLGNQPKISLKKPEKGLKM
uniref:Uncharacterized protein n=1 Tax=Romanomermis culicivorax TaxID=13658 RepID=A0A915KVX2_ROMCU